METKPYFYALHGFLGSPLDWIDVFAHAKDSSLHFECADLFGPTGKTSPGASQSSSGISQSHSSVNQSNSSLSVSNLSNFDNLIQHLQQRLAESEYYPSSSKRVFLGYSLGARIGMNWLRLFPNDFTKWVFISGHPGLQNDLEKTERRQNDQKWADKLVELPFRAFLKLWNEQEIFKTNSQLPAQRVLEFDIEKLKCGLLNLGLAQQQDHRDILRLNKDQVIWVTGKQDQKFTKIAQELYESGIIKNWVQLEAGHRVHIEKPAEILKLL